mmetsp:Transcript_7545/g.15869  ORF Transcript_7545/g.15869 Transcript_7545/m.15869 type:complete len:217 (-) Transcript_7545:745-1395(-)
MARVSEGLKQVEKIIDALAQRNDSEPFREPVNWREIGLFDYPQIVKKPMSLSDVKAKIASGQYRSPAECAEDVRLIWSNCMLYNQDGSEFYKLAKKFANRFEEKFNKVKVDEVVVDGEDDRPPSLEEKTKFAHNIYKIKSEELGEVVTKLDQSCPHALDKKPEKDEIEINIDSIDPRTFHTVDRMVKEYLPEALKKSKKKKSTGGETAPAAKKAKA